MTESNKHTMTRLKTRKKVRTTKKEVKEFKNPFYLTLLRLLKQGFNPEKISRRFNKPIQNIQYYITKLEKDGYIQKVGYGTWELTKLGRFVTTKKFIWGPHEGTKKIELWRMGYRFFVKHDAHIPELKEQILKNGGKVHQGRVLGCWVTKGKETLDIYGTVARSNNVWDAAINSMMELVACKGFLEDEYGLMLEPMNPMRPDIIIDTPETRRLAEKIHNELGRVRTEFFEIDESKTGRPELEARTLDTAKAVLDNLGLNKSVDLDRKVSEIQETMRGYIPQQVAISNALNLQSVTLKELSSAIHGIMESLKRLTKPGFPENETTTPQHPREPVRTEYGHYSLDRFLGVGGYKDDDIVEVEITEDTGDFVGLLRGEPIDYNFRKGAKAHLEYSVADVLVKNHRARFI